MNNLSPFVKEFAGKIIEAASLNNKSGEDSVFPNEEYRVFVKRINKRLKTPPYINIVSRKEGFHIMVTTYGKLIQVKNYGNRKFGDKFEDVCDKVKLFMEENFEGAGKFTESGGKIKHVVKVLWKMTEII